jgi:hypothetical protein
MDMPAVYEIRVEGRLDPRWSDWFNGLSVTKGGENETVISGEVADQAALRGLLEKVWDLNLVLVSVRRL